LKKKCIFVLNKKKHMQTLLFNTTTKTVKTYEGNREESNIIFNLNNVPTVKIRDGFYEVMQKDYDDTPLPVLRLPISNTNMIIEK